MSNNWSTTLEICDPNSFAKSIASEFVKDLFPRPVEMRREISSSVLLFCGVLVEPEVVEFIRIVGNEGCIIMSRIRLELGFDFE